MKWGLSDKSIHAILPKYPAIDRAVLCGSRDKGNFQKGSDIDLALFGKDLNYDILGKINCEFDDSYLPYKFDLSIFSTLSDPDFIDHIERVGLTFYEKR